MGGGETGARAILVVWVTLVSLISYSSSSPITTATTLTSSVPTSISIQKSVSFEARDSKTWKDEPIIMQMLTKDSYFPASAESKSTELPLAVSTLATTTTSEAPKEPNPSTNEVNSEPRPQASSLSYSTSSNGHPWTPLPPNQLPLAAQPMYFPAPALYGYPVNNYGPPVINFGGGPPSPVTSFGAGVKQAIEPSFYSIPVKSIEYIPPGKSDYAGAVEKMPQYNAVRVPYERPIESTGASSYGAPVAQSYGAPGPSASYVTEEQPSEELPGLHASGALTSPVGAAYGAPAQVAEYGGPAQIEDYGAPAQNSGYGVPAQGASYGPPVYGAPHSIPTTVKKNVHNVHQKVLHRYNHHQKVLHEHNLHRYIIHNYHLHRYHVHNIHQEKEHIHVHKDHVHQKYQQKETEEHRTKETKGETHKHLTEVKESQRHLPPVQAPLYAAKPHWSIWG